MSRRSRRIAGAAAAFLVLLALIAGAREGQAFLIRGASFEERAAEFTQGRPSVSVLLSSFGRRALLDACLDTLGEAADGGSANAAKADAIARGCLSLAGDIVARAPVSPNEWLIAAQLAARAGDIDRLETDLRRSFAAGPAEQWVAETRALFVYELASLLTPDIRAKGDEDLALLLRTDTGVHALAAAYVDDESLRAHLVDIAVTLEPALQARFLGLVKDAAAHREAGPAS